MQQSWLNDFFRKMAEIFLNGALSRGAIQRGVCLSQICLKPKMLSLTSFLGHFVAQTASQGEDFGLQANLEKTSSLFTTLFSAPFKNISIIIRKCLIISES